MQNIEKTLTFGSGTCLLHTAKKREQNEFTKYTDVKQSKLVWQTLVKRISRRFGGQPSNDNQ